MDELIVKGCPKEAWDYEFVVVKYDDDGGMVYVGHYANGFTAEKQATKNNGIIIHNVRIQGHR